MQNSIIPSAGFILISAEPESTGGLSLPGQSQGYIRSGRVLAAGAPIYHVSGKELPSPVGEDETAYFRYIENMDVLAPDGTKYYLVEFNQIAGWGVVGE